jgi:hypothetical protein
VRTATSDHLRGGGVKPIDGAMAKASSKGGIKMLGRLDWGKFSVQPSHRWRNMERFSQSEKGERRIEVYGMI